MNNKIIEINRKNNLFRSNTALHDTNITLYHEIIEFHNKDTELHNSTMTYIKIFA